MSVAHGFFTLVSRKVLKNKSLPFECIENLNKLFKLRYTPSFKTQIRFNNVFIFDIILVPDFIVSVSV